MTDGLGRQLVILCEGFDDRSFWAGWMEHLGCTDPSQRGKKKVKDIWGRTVAGKGRYLFELGERKILVQPTGGRDHMADAAEEWLGDNQLYRPDRLILNLDCDDERKGDHHGRDLFHGILRTYGIKRPKGNGPFSVNGTQVGGVFWECKEGSVGIPPKQTLERLVSAAILAAYPDRGPTVDRWLNDDPVGDKVAKSFSFSYLAKWYADQGSDDFFRALWREKEVADELEKLLRTCGAWDLVEEMLRPA